MGVITFNNVTSKDLGIEVETFPDYVAPEKEYQVTHVPGRNGDLVVDTKTYKNVPRPYKVSMAVEPPAVSVSGSTASFEATAERALAECKTVISSDVGKVGTTIINSATDPVENNEPYNFRAVPNGVGDHENDTLIGGTVAWNQLVQNGNFTDNSVWGKTNVTLSVSNNVATITLTAVDGFLRNSIPMLAGHKYLRMLDVKGVNGVTYSFNSEFPVTVANGNWQTLSNIANVTTSGTHYLLLRSNETSDFQPFYARNVVYFDLTQMFGSTIADYIYGLETATAGAGVAWFRNLFPKDYYAYNAGELISVKTEAHKMVGFNQFDKNDTTNWINAYISTTIAGGIGFKTVIIPCIPNTTYYAKHSKGNRLGLASFVDYPSVGDTAEHRSQTSTQSGGNVSLTTRANDHYLACYFYNQTVDSGLSVQDVADTLVINISWDGERNGEYEPYEEHTYALDSDLELRGIPKLDTNNKLYYDGDIYSSDGSVIRKYGIVDLGTLSWSKDTTTRPADGATIHAWYATLYAARNSSDTAGFVGNLLVSGYKRTTTLIVDYGGRDTVDDKLVGGADTNHRIWLYNSAYSDYTGAQIKTALSGVYLIYELATPVIESTSGLIDNVSIASFDDGADNEPVNSLVVDITAIESGSGEKSPTNPYTISGFANGIITRCGVNLCDEVFETGDISFSTGGNITGASWIRSTNYVPIVSGLTIYVKSTQNINIFFYDCNKAYLGNNSKGLKPNIKNTVITISNNACYFRIATNQTPYNHDISINYPSTDTQYHAYNGNTYTFQFGQTVYGGHFDNKGEVESELDLITYDGSSDEGWQKNGEYFYIDVSSDNQVSFTVISNQYQGMAPTHYTSVPNGYIALSNSYNYLNIHDNSYATLEDFKTALSNTNLQVLYKKATPTIVQLTPTEVKTLLGVNNIFANTGNIKSLSYPKQVCPFEPAQEVDDHGTEEYIDNREVAIPVGHESKYFTAGKIYNFSWLDEAGLIKEGELNADTGVLTITDGYGIVDLGDLTWTLSSSTAEYFSTPKSAINEGMVALSCSVYKVYTTDPSLDKSLFQTSSSIRIRDSSFFRSVSSSVVDPTFKSAMHGVKLLYELADPVRTIQLTPVQVESLIGHNVLISESGNISVTPRTYSTYTEKMNAISDWLHSASGYARLEDTYEPDYYRKAYYDEQTDMENIFNEAGQATLNFICKPQRYLKSGEEPITISSGGLIQNRTRYEAYPILKVTTNNTQGSVAIGNHSITIKAGAGTDPITIDCELQDAWSGTSNKNSYIVLTDGEFPVIDPGIQTVTFNGGIQSVEVIPRWWTV